MTTPSHYPFSDLTSEQVQRLDPGRPRSSGPGHPELFRGALRRRRATPAWPSRQRETQVWPPKNVPALSLTVYR